MRIICGVPDGCCGEKIIGRTLKARGGRHKVIIGTKVDHGQRRPGFTLDELTPESGPNDHGH